MVEPRRVRLAGGATPAAEGDRLAAAGRLEEALAAYQAALTQTPDNPEVRSNLGNVLLGLGRTGEALAAYQAVLAMGFDHPLVCYNMGTALRALGRPEEALPAFEAALVRAPGFAPAHNNRGNALRDLGRQAEAALAYLEALALRPGDAGTRVNLSSALSLLHEQDAAGAETAAGLARRWRTAHPDDPMARHVAAAMAGGPPPPRAEDGYVRQLFDGFAAGFDRRLATLDYRVPGLVAATLARLWPQPTSGLATSGLATSGLAVLDAGCGTGLAAAMLRPYARTLTGVDLSPEMLELARQRGLYDALETAELTGFLAGHPEAFDLIVAADVLCYFGELGPVLRAAAAALGPGGRLIFTVELDPRPEAPPFTLQPNGRYRQTPSAVMAALTAAGLAAPPPASVILRRENGRDVAGGLVEAGRRPVPDGPSRPEIADGRPTG